MFSAGCDPDRVDAVRDALAPLEVLALAGVTDLAPPMPCPFCGAPERAAKTFKGDDGVERYKCHRGSCGIVDDAIGLVRRIWGHRTFRAAVDHAAKLAGIGPTVAIDPVELQRRADERARRQAEAETQRRLKRDEGIKLAENVWHYGPDDDQDRASYYLGRRGLPLARARWHDAARMHACRTYLATRKLEAVLDLAGAGLVVSAMPDGSPTTALYGFDRRRDGMNPIVNVAWRRIPRREWEPEAEPPQWVTTEHSPSKLVLKGCTTIGTFGETWRLGANTRRVIVVEGIADYFAAQLAFPPGGEDLVLGAHAVGHVPRIVDHVASTIAEHRAELLLVTHIDASGAGQQHEREAMAVARTHGLVASRFDLGDYGDLADWWACR